MEILLPFLSAFIFTILAIPATIALAKKFGLVDDPTERPHPAHVQLRVIPRAGGLAIFIGLVSSILLFVPLEKHIFGILIALTLLLLMGLLDDKLRNFSPYTRIILQILAAGIVVASGIGVSFITNPFGGVLRLDTFVIPIQFLGSHNIIVIADLLAFLWIVWVMNIVNWSKGVDGQMPGIILVAAIAIALLSWKLFLEGDPNQFHIATLAFITAGTAAGFLIFNWYPSKILPGFSGSTILGFMIATLSILNSAKLATALLVLLIPAADFIYIFFRRVLSGKSPVYADNGHLHHKLLTLGWSHQKISLFYILSCAILGLLAMSLSSQDKFYTSVAIGMLAIGSILWLNLLLRKPKTK